MKKFSALRRRVAELEGKFCRLQSEMAITSTVNNVLQQKLDEMQQYLRRSCLVIDGIKPAANENPQELKQKIKNLLTKKPQNGDEDGGHTVEITAKEFEAEFDKCHRIGPVRDGKQAAIIRLKSHGFKEKIYGNRKNLVKRTPHRIRVSLTQHRAKLLASANEMVENNDKVKFAFADINGNLRLLLNSPFRRKWTLNFSSKEELTLKLIELTGSPNDDVFSYGYSDYDD